MINEAELDRLSMAGQIINEVQMELPVLKSISWPRSLAEDFFANGESRMPRPEYAPIDMTGKMDKLMQARALLHGDTPLHQWLLRLADVMDTTMAMLESRGTKDFYRHSCVLYGDAHAPIADGAHSALDLARRLDMLLGDIDQGSEHFAMPEVISSHDLKAALDNDLTAYFGEDPPKVIIASDASAKAVATKSQIKIREDAIFSDLDRQQLLQHEALIHIATGRNGANQVHFPILGEAHPGNARTQEGLAVFAEFISGSIDPMRFRRLADRVIAIDMAANGADFMELYRFFRAQQPHAPAMEAFESARRVVRGGLVEGGAPFTKDAIYLSGLLEVHSYLRAAIRSGDPRYIQYLFVGKIDLNDLFAIRMMDELGILVSPQFKPDWASDMRYLLAYLSYSTFINQIDMQAVHMRFSDLFQ